MARSLDILLVTATDDSRALYVEGLSWFGFSVEATALPADALEQAASASLIVVDVDMRSAIDFAFVRELRQHHPAKPVVVLSAFAAERDRELARAAGGDIFLTKPCIPECLAKHVCRVLARSKVSVSRPLRVLPQPRCVNPQHQRPQLFDLLKTPAADCVPNRPSVISDMKTSRRRSSTKPRPGEPQDRGSSR